MIKIVKFSVLIILLTISANILKAQHSQTLYYMNRLPQSMQMNPAIQPECGFYLGFPVISSVQVGVGNNRISLNDAIQKHPTEDSLITFLHPLANKEDFLSNIKNLNFLYENIHTNLFSFGFRANDWYASFNISERQSSTFTYPKDLISLVLNGNQEFNNSNIDFTDLDLNITYFREYGVSLSKTIGSQWTVGGRLKVLFGKANISVENHSFKLYSSIDSIHINSDIRVNASLPVESTTNADGDFDGFENIDTVDPLDFALDHSNMGFAIDLGATYRPIDKVSVSLSIIDLGYIKWSKGVTNLDLNGEFNYTGIDLSSEFDETDNSDPFETLTDSIENSFTITDKKESYTTPLGAKIYIGGSYYLTPKLNFSLLSQSRFYESKLYQAFTLSANARPIRGLSTSISYSIMDGNYSNLGFGLVLRPGPFQIYVISDNAASIALWGQKATGLNLRFGMNFAFGCKKKIKDFPMLKSSF
ncbi:MAG: DUF5723 family protein [Bacteroidales bacterium]|jgi:hypothetical protein|nr:DUF5723 family protein [Bacteroidales bacterium]